MEHHPPEHHPPQEQHAALQRIALTLANQPARLGGVLAPAPHDRFAGGLMAYIWFGGPLLRWPITDQQQQDEPHVDTSTAQDTGSRGRGHKDVNGFTRHLAARAQAMREGFVEVVRVTAPRPLGMTTGRAECASCAARVEAGLVTSAFADRCGLTPAPRMAGGEEPDAAAEDAEDTGGASRNDQSAGWLARSERTLDPADSVRAAVMRAAAVATTGACSGLLPREEAGASATRTPDLSAAGAPGASRPKDPSSARHARQALPAPWLAVGGLCAGGSAALLRRGAAMR